MKAARAFVVAAVTLVIAACDGPTILEVDGRAVGADRVELVIAGEPCSVAHCTVTGPDGTAASPVLLRDGLVRTAAVPDGSGLARFQLEPGDASDTALGSTIILGWHGDTPVGFVALRDLPLGKAGVFEVTLAAPPAQSRKFAVWTNDATKPTTAQYACVTVPDGSSTITIVPAEDPDCDGFTGADECPGGAYTYHYMQPASLAAFEGATCVGDAPTMTGLPFAACRVGADGCVDGAVDQGMSGGCTPSRFCVPQGVCDDCAASPTLGKCIIQEAGKTTEPVDLYADCGVYIHQDDNGDPTVCTPSHDMATMQVNLAAALGYTDIACVPDAAADGGFAVQFATVPDLGASVTDLEFGPGIEWRLAGGVDVKLDRGASAAVEPNNCNVGLVVTSAPAVATNVPVAVRAIARYQLANQFYVYVPLRLTFALADACPSEPPATANTLEPACEFKNLAPPTNGPDAQKHLSACFAPTASPTP